MKMIKTLCSFRRSRLHPARQQLNRRCRQLVIILGHRAEATLVIDGAEESWFLTDGTGGGVGAEVDIVGQIGGIVAAGFGAGGIENGLNLSSIGWGQARTVHFVRGIVILAGDDQYGQAADRKHDL